MTDLSRRDIEHIFEQLRKGLVPERGLDAFAVGIERQRGEIHRQLDLIADGEGSIKFLRGGYGCGKTFMARLAVLDAQQRGFATSFVVVSDNDTRFHRFDDVYRKVVSELGTSSCPRGALSDILDRWISRVEDNLIHGGADEDATNFEERVRARLKEELDSLTGGKAPSDFVRVVQTVFDLKEQGELGDAGALLSWLAGSDNVAASAKKAAGIKGDISSKDALGYLRGIVEIVKAAGYKGLVIVIDEAETILRMRKDSRHKSLNGLRQISDAAGDYGGLLWLVTGTPEFFDTRQGVAGLAPLHDRIRFMGEGPFVNIRQAQLPLVPFKAERLRQVALRLRGMFPMGDRDRLDQAVSDGFIDQLVAQVTAGFKGDVGVVPRQFLRELVDVLDRVEQYPEFDPSEQYGFEPKGLSAEEVLAQQGMPAVVTAPDAEADELVAKEDMW